jgi:hypothetical protein
MLGSLTTAAALALAKLALDKFAEGAAGELGKKLTESATQKVMALGSVIWEKVKGSDRAIQVLAEVEQGKPGAELQLKNYLNSFWKDDQSPFVQEVKKLADDLHFELTQIEDNSSLTVNVSGNAKAWVNKEISGGTVNQADSITIHQHGPSED